MNDQITRTPISRECLARYPKINAPNYDLLPRGAIEISKLPEWGLLQLVHAKCSGTAATPYAWGEEYFIDHQKHFPLIEGTTVELAQNLAHKFVNTQAALENENTKITKEEAAEGLAGFYHILSPTNDANRYVRSLVEKSFEVLDLGPIPPAKFTATEISRRKNNANPSDGVSP